MNETVKKTDRGMILGNKYCKFSIPRGKIEMNETKKISHGYY